MDEKSYEAPRLESLGRLENLTQQDPQFNKVGPTPDTFASTPVVGSLVPFP